LSSHKFLLKLNVSFFFFNSLAAVVAAVVHNFLLVAAYKCVTQKSLQNEIINSHPNSTSTHSNSSTQLLSIINTLF